MRSRCEECTRRIHRRVFFLPLRDSHRGAHFAGKRCLFCVSEFGESSLDLEGLRLVFENRRLTIDPHRSRAEMKSAVVESFCGCVCVPPPVAVCVSHNKALRDDLSRAARARWNAIPCAAALTQSGQRRLVTLGRLYRTHAHACACAIECVPPTAVPQRPAAPSCSFFRAVASVVWLFRRRWSAATQAAAVAARV